MSLAGGVVPGWFAVGASGTPLGSSVSLSKPFGWGFDAAHQPGLQQRLERQERL